METLQRLLKQLFFAYFQPASQLNQWYIDASYVCSCKYTKDGGSARHAPTKTLPSFIAAISPTEPNARVNFLIMLAEQRCPIVVDLDPYG